MPSPFVVVLFVLLTHPSLYVVFGLWMESVSADGITSPPPPDTGVKSASLIDTPETVDGEEEEGTETLHYGPAKVTVADELAYYLDQEIGATMDMLGYTFSDPMLLAFSLISPEFYQRCLANPFKLFKGTSVEHWVERYDGLGEVGRIAMRCAITIGYLEDHEKSTALRDAQYVPFPTLWVVLCLYCCL